MDLDDFDRRLLNLVQNDAGQTAEELAGNVGLSASAVRRRLKRLREAGVIVREAAILGLKSLGSPTFLVTGQTDFVLVVTAPNVESYEALMARLISDHPNVKCFTTSMVLNVIKRGLAMPVP